MELPQAPLPPLPTPPSPVLPQAPVPSQKFQKSTGVLFLAYIPLAIFLLSLLVGGFSFLFAGSGFLFPGILFLAPSGMVIFSKTESVYKVGKYILYTEFILGLLSPIILIIALSNMHW